MKCPLRNIKVTLGSTQQSIYTEDCLQAECAWWDEENHLCAILSLTVELNGIHSEVDALIKRRGEA